jgi:hypothetical protein
MRMKEFAEMARKIDAGELGVEDLTADERATYDSWQETTGQLSQEFSKLGTVGDSLSGKLAQLGALQSPLTGKLAQLGQDIEHAYRLSLPTFDVAKPSAIDTSFIEHQRRLNDATLRTPELLERMVALMADQELEAEQRAKDDRRGNRIQVGLLIASLAIAAAGLVVAIVR